MGFSNFIKSLFFFIILFLMFFSRLEVWADTTATLRPIADGGDDSANWSNTAGTACSAIDCYTEVDESSGAECTDSDGDTTFVKSKVNGAIQTLDISELNIPDDSTITQISITTCAKKHKEDAAFQTRYCHNGSCSDSGRTIAPDESYTGYTQNHTVNFIKTSGSDIEIGLTNMNDKEVKISQISTIITYTPPGSPPDTSAPAAVSNLSLSDATASSINLSWTAPGDDNNTGTASSYDIRYSTSEITDANWSSVIQTSNEPSPSVAGSSESMTITGLLANTIYYFALKTSDEVPNTSGLSNVPNLTTPSFVSTPAAGGELRIAFFSGQAYPECKIELLTKRAKLASFAAEPIEELTVLDDGRFQITATGLLGVGFLFALRIEDKEGKKTGIISFDVDLRSENKLIAKDIFVPPTIGFEKTIVTKGQELKIKGYAAPNNKIEIEMDDITRGEVQSDETGYWTFTAGTADLNLGEHYIRARQIDTSDRESDFSSFQVFKVSLLELPKADFNNDSIVNIADWSIFLFRWGSEDKTLKSKIDMNDDGNINIADFSIFLRTMKI